MLMYMLNRKFIRLFDKFILETIKDGEKIFMVINR